MIDDIVKMQGNFDKCAERYDNHAHMQRETARHLAQAVHDAGVTRGTLLDLGCGTGFVVGYLRELLKHDNAPHYIQLDSSPAMCHLAARYGQTLVGDICDIPLEDDSVSVITSNLALQWVTPMEAAFAEMRRVLQPGGKIILNILCDGSLRELHAAWRRAGMPPMLKPLPDAQHIKAAAQRGGLDITLKEVVHEEHYPNVLEILKRMNNIGAKSPQISSITRKMIADIGRQYRIDQGSDDDMLKVSWNVAMALHKASS